MSVWSDLFDLPQALIMMAGSEHTDNALHSQLSTDPHSPTERRQRRCCGCWEGEGGGSVKQEKEGKFVFSKLVY